MKKSLICCILVIALLAPGAALAKDEEIVITSDRSANPADITAEQPTIDLPVAVKGLDDVYAFTLTLQYPADKVSVDSIAAGDIFADYGSAVLKNDIDNADGNAAFMQTILSSDKGTDRDGTLCIIRLTLAPGEYDLVSDLGLKIKIANSAPKYIPVYVTGGRIIADKTQESDGEEPEAEPTPLPSAAVGVIPPAAGAEQSEEFISAEDQTADEIMEAIAGMEEKTESGGTPAANAQETGPGEPGASDEPAETQGQAAGQDNSVYMITAVLIAAGCLAVLLALLFFKQRKKRIKRGKPRLK